MIRTALLLALATLLLPAADRPINGGPNNTRYTALSQITPANVYRTSNQPGPTTPTTPLAELQTQSNPIVIDGILYATTPKLRVIALDARTAASSSPTIPPPATPFSAASAIAALKGVAGGGIGREPSSPACRPRRRGGLGGGGRVEDAVDDDGVGSRHSEFLKASCGRRRSRRLRGAKRWRA